MLEWKLQHYIKEHCVTDQWTDEMLLVKNIGTNATLDELCQLFTDAEDIVIAGAELESQNQPRRHKG